MSDWKRKWFKKEDASVRDIAEDVIKSLLQWAFVSAFGFLYWMLVLLLASIFLMNIWITSFEKILRYGIILAVITSVFYAGVIVYRKLH